jgi:hypothetical protein
MEELIKKLKISREFIVEGKVVLTQILLQS